MGVVRSFRDILLEDSYCELKDIDQAESIRQEYGGTLGNILLNLGVIS